MPLGDRQSLCITFRCVKTTREFRARGRVSHAAEFLPVIPSGNTDFDRLFAGKLELTNVSLPHFVEGQKYLLTLRATGEPPQPDASASPPPALRARYAPEEAA